MSVSQKDVYRVLADASKMGAEVLGGQLSMRSGSFVINQTDVNKLLESLSGQNVFLIVGSVEVDAPENELRTCLTCGRDYVGQECPRCANVRARLRGT